MTIDEIRDRLVNDPRSYTEIAEAAGCSHGQLTRFANGDRVPGGALMLDLIGVLGLEIIERAQEDRS